MNLKIITKVSEETKKRISLSKIGQGNKPVLQIGFDGSLIREFVSILEASNETKINRSGISAVCRCIQKTAGGFYWKYK